MARIDFRSILILVLAGIIVCMAIFGKGSTDTSLLDQQIKARELENKALQDSIAERDKNILAIDHRIDSLTREDTLKASIIKALMEVDRRQKLDINFLKFKLTNVAQPIEDATDEQRIEFWRSYFKKRGLSTKP